VVNGTFIIRRDAEVSEAGWEMVKGIKETGSKGETDNVLEIIHGIIKATSKGEMSYLQWKVIYFLVKCVSKCKMSYIGWEVIHLLIEFGSKGEMGDA